MDFVLQVAAEAIGEAAAESRDVDDVAQAAGKLAAQVGKSGGISKAEATMLSADAQMRARDLAGKAGLPAEDIEAAVGMAGTAASFGAVLGQAFFGPSLLRWGAQWRRDRGSHSCGRRIAQTTRRPGAVTSSLARSGN
jgi:hypothetical protein